MQLYAERRKKKTKTKQQPQLLTENEEDFFHFPSTVDTTTEEAGRVRRRTKIFRHLLVHRQIHQRFDFRSTHIKPTSQAATENATNYPIQHHKHPQPLQC